MFKLLNLSEYDLSFASYLPISTYLFKMMTTSVPRRNVTTIDDVKRVFKQLLDAEAPKNAMEGDLRSEELDSAVAEVRFQLYLSQLFR